MAMQDDLRKSFASLKEFMKGFKMENEALRSRVALLERDITNWGATRWESVRMHIPEPKCFKGARDAKEMENILWQMKNYFKVAKVEKAAKIAMVTMFLVDDAMLW